MEYFHLGIFVIPRVYLIRKYGSQTQAISFVSHDSLKTSWSFTMWISFLLDTVWYYGKLSLRNLEKNLKTFNFLNHLSVSLFFLTQLRTPYDLLPKRKTVRNLHHDMCVCPISKKWAKDYHSTKSQIKTVKRLQKRSQILS